MRKIPTEASMALPETRLSLHETMKEKGMAKYIDTATYIVGIGGNLAVVPQIIKAWESDAPGLAVLTWVLFTLIGLVWLAYAILHEQKPLIVAQTIGISCNLLVVLGWVFNHWVV